MNLSKIIPYITPAPIVALKVVLHNNKSLGMSVGTARKTLVHTALAVGAYVLPKQFPPGTFKNYMGVAVSLGCILVPGFGSYYLLTNILIDSFQNSLSPINREKGTNGSTDEKSKYLPPLVVIVRNMAIGMLACMACSNDARKLCDQWIEKHLVVGIFGN